MKSVEHKHALFAQTLIDNNRQRTFCIGVGGRTTGIPILVR